MGVDSCCSWILDGVVQDNASANYCPHEIYILHSKLGQKNLHYMEARLSMEDSWWLDFKIDFFHVMVLLHQKHHNLLHFPQAAIGENIPINFQFTTNVKSKDQEIIHLDTVRLMKGIWGKFGFGDERIFPFTYGPNKTVIWIKSNWKNHIHSHHLSPILGGIFIQTEGFKQFQLQLE